MLLLLAFSRKYLKFRIDLCTLREYPEFPVSISDDIFEK